MENEDYAIQLKGVYKSFREGRDSILKGIDLKFQTGKLTYILGPSGTGKSVTIKHILGLLKPDEGEVWVLGKRMDQLSREDLLQMRNRFGMLFQSSALFDDMTVFENVAFPLFEHTHLTLSEVEEKVFKTLKLLGMPEGFDKFPNEISGGMKKRVALARAIIREPAILSYDEPTTGLDPVTRLTVDKLIEQLKREYRLTSIVISHDIPSALRLADQIAFLYGGHVVFNGTPDEFRKADHPAIQNFLNAERESYETLF